ncbi:coniferyl aldehyde dehydrogenase [Parasalinivibrio latis]|uniref:coniferyl aldehyde dehydrogenase n=1 Tax=Parasalinivibrio latis TaxID=2952610 RepID=UPI0030DFADD0
MTASSPVSEQISQMQKVFARQKDACRANPFPDYDSRIADLSMLKRALLTHKQALCDAMSADYGHRSLDDSLIADILPCVLNINYTRRKLKRWMKPSRRNPGLLLHPASVSVHYQPKGVVGIIVPWNFPVMLSIGPLITALAAGNRVMLKLSEFTPETNLAITRMLGEIFQPDQVAVIEGEADVAAAFSGLPFDHLLFTGSTAVGRHVMRTAAEHLTPVTLELGGKSPVLIDPEMPLEKAVSRLMYGKCLNAGQICVAPDYVLLPNGREKEFAEIFTRLFNRMFKKGLDSRDFSSVVNARQYARIKALLEDAREKGAEIIPVCEPAMDDAEHRLVPHLILNATDDMNVLHEEIFGPLLPVIGYRSFDEGLSYVNEHARPLALYLMSENPELVGQVAKHTHSGGMTVNDTLMQVAADDAPFGGIGPSGMGHYHGVEGFRTFSHAKTVFKRGKLDPGALIHPPYGGLLHRLVMKIFMR